MKPPRLKWNNAQKGINPCDSQNLVAALLTAMGHQVRRVPPPGPDTCVTLVESGGQKTIVVVGVAAG